MKTAIVTDSTAYIPDHIKKEFNIYICPLNVIFGQESFQEEVDISTSEFYEKVKTSSDFPKTSQPAIGFFVETFEKLAKEYDAVISIHLSSGISGTYQASVSAGQMVEGIKVYSFDSEISAMIQGFYVIEAAEMAREGKEPEEILDRMEKMKESMRAYFMVDDLSHLQRGGRLSGAQAFVGSLLQVKPILTFQDKKIIPFEKIRTRKKAEKRLVELFGEVASSNEPMKVVVIHGNRPEEGDKLKEKILVDYPKAEVFLSYFGPVIATHLGEGAMGIGWYKI